MKEPWREARRSWHSSQAGDLVKCQQQLYSLGTPASGLPIWYWQSLPCSPGTWNTSRGNQSWEKKVGGCHSWNIDWLANEKLHQNDPEHPRYCCCCCIDPPVRLKLHYAATHEQNAKILKFLRSGHRLILYPEGAVHRFQAAVAEWCSKLSGWRRNLVLSVICDHVVSS